MRRLGVRPPVSPSVSLPFCAT